MIKDCVTTGVLGLRFLFIALLHTSLRVWIGKRARLSIGLTCHVCSVRVSIGLQLLKAAGCLLGALHGQLLALLHHLGGARHHCWRGCSVGWAIGRVGYPR